MYYSFDNQLKELIDFIMRTIHLFHISDSYIGTNPVLEPRVPEFACFNEDEHTPRICCSLTIPGCFIAKETSFQLLDNLSSQDYYLYSADVDLDSVYQPTNLDVPDSWQTGELWVVKPQEFKYVTTYRLRQHMDVSEKAFYSRYSCTACGYDEVVDRITASPIYGDMNAFSYIEFDSYRYRNKNKDIDVKIPVLKQEVGNIDISSGEDLFHINDKVQ